MKKFNLQKSQSHFKFMKSAFRYFHSGDLLNFFLFEKHNVIDKWLHYFPIYEKYFNPYRTKDINFVEIGIQNGGSLQMWRKYFSQNSHIIGIDINPECKKLETEFNDKNISIHIGSSTDKEFWKKFKNKYPVGSIDILLDDGGHTMDQQIFTFNTMFPWIKDGGLYICEDCHTSYYKEFNAGLNIPGTFIEFCKKLIDDINGFHSEIITYNTIHISGIHFYDSIVIIEKGTVSFEPFSLRLGSNAPVISNIEYIDNMKNDI